MTSRKIIALVTASVLAFASHAQSQTPAAPVVDMQMPSESEVVMEIPTATEAVPVSRDADTIQVDYPDEDIRVIIRNVADLYDLNVVIPETLQGRASIKLKNVSWRQVFKIVLDQVDFTFVEEDNIISIKTKAEVAAEPPRTKVFQINFATAAELQSSIAPLVDQAVGGRLQVDKRSNTIVVTERQSRLDQIQIIIDQLDRPTEQVMIESKFVEITNRDIKNLGVRWDSLSGYGVEAGPFQRDYSKNNQTTTTQGENRNTVTNSTTPVGTDAVEDSTGTRNFTGSTPFSQLNSLTTGKIDTAIFSADSFGVVLSALNNENEIEVISNPTVVTLNNSQAQIHIGEEYPIPNYTYNSERGTFEVQGFEYKPIGITLNVTPQVNSAGFINLDIAPEISNRTGEVSFGGGAGANIPIITTRKTESNVTIKSGFTLAIGGLIEKTQGNTVNKVPGLSSIPGLGRLFKHSSKSLDKRNLIIFITAKTLSADGSTYRDVFSQRTLFDMGIKSRDLPGYQPPAAEQQLFENIQQARDNIEMLRAEALLKQQVQSLEKEKTTIEKKYAEPVEGSSSSPRRYNK